MAWTEILVAIDVGTSGARAAAFGLEGNRLLEVRQGYPTASVATGWAEQDPRAWRRAALSALKGLVSSAGCDSNESRPSASPGSAHRSAWSTRMAGPSVPG